ncbi:MAG: hypothetical protein WBK55_03625 [Alphaproteobacteria bacterium]
MLKRYLLLGSVICLSSCSYTLDRQIQDITVVTPGAEDTVCYMYVDGLRYKFFPPQTMNITKSRKDLVVDCIAPQNRRRKVVIEPALSQHAPLNVANGIIPGTTWDIASNSLFTYPEVVTVDFTSAVPMPEALPAQNNPDIRQPEEYDLEEFTSKLPRLNSDRDAVATPLIRRGGAQSAKPEYTSGGVGPHTGPGKPKDKGDLGSVIDGLTTSSSPPSKPVEPAGPPASAASEPAGPPPMAISPYPLSTKPAPPAAGPVMTGPDVDGKAGPPIPLAPSK